MRRGAPKKKNLKCLAGFLQEQEPQCERCRASFELPALHKCVTARHFTLHQSFAIPSFHGPWKKAL